MEDFFVSTTVSNIGKARRETLYGQEYLVAPMTILVPGVLNGSEGPLFYPVDEVAKSPEAWNFKPITVGHPPESASIPKILNSFGMGFLLNSRFDKPNPNVDNGKLVADGWFNILRLMGTDTRIYNALVQGTPFELSTGLKVKKEILTNEADYNGKKYKVIARNYQPDHLAILMDSVGACSIKDGCGVLVNELKPVIENCSPDEKRELVLILNSSLSSPDEKEEPTMAKKELVDSLISNCSCWKDTKEDRDTLNAMPDDKVQSLIDAAKAKKSADEVANAAKAGFEDGINSHVFNETTKKWESKPKETKPNPAQGTDNTPVTNQGNPTQPAPLTKEAVLNAMKGLTPAEWFEIAPPEVQENHRESVRIANEEKAKLVQRWVDNAAPDKKDSAKAWAEKQSLTDLREVVATLPVKNSNNPYSPSSSQPNYSGQAAGVYNSGEKIEKPTPMGLPKWDFTPAGK